MHFNFYGFDDKSPIKSPKRSDDDSPQLIEMVKVGKELMNKIILEEILLDKQPVKKMNSEGEEEEWYQLSKDYRLSLGKSLTGILEGEYSKAIHELRSDSANESEKSQVDIPNNRQVLIQLLSYIEDEKITYFDLD